MQREWKEFLKKVNEIDEDAACYLKLCVPTRYTHYSDLACCMIWSETPQGYSYWNAINDKLKGEAMSILTKFKYGREWAQKRNLIFGRIKGYIAALRQIEGEGILTSSEHHDLVIARQHLEWVERKWPTQNSKSKLSYCLQRGKRGD